MMGGTVNAQSKPDTLVSVLSPVQSEIALAELISKPKADKPTNKYKVKKGDTLEKIAKKYKTTTKRLFNKNLKIESPDVIESGQVILIPSKTEKLTDRKFPKAVPTPVSSSNSSLTSPKVGLGSSNISGLLGSIGYAVAGGNCVNEPGVNNPGYGNPIDWPVLSGTPTIGATALWNYNHTGVVTGIWSNGDIEVRHQNYGGGQHRFSPSEFRGFR